MKRVCVLGDSHVGALKQAWDAIKAGHPDLEMVFFAAPGAGMNGVVARAGRIEPDTEAVARMFATTSGGETAVDLARYDAFVVTGLGLGIKPVEQLFRRFAPEDGRNATGLGRHVSSECFDAAAAGLVADTIAAGLVDSLAAETTRPIYLLMPPHRAAKAAGLPRLLRHWRDRAERDEIRFLRRATRSGTAAAIAALHAAAVAGRFAAKATIVPQPPETVEDHIHTRSRFAKQAISLRHFARRDTIDDLKHMNGDYGRLALAALIARMATAEAQPV